MTQSDDAFIAKAERLLDARDDRRRQLYTTVIPIVITILLALGSGLWYVSGLATTTSVVVQQKRIDALEKELLQLKTKYETEASLRRESNRTLRRITQELGFSARHKKAKP